MRIVILEGCDNVGKTTIAQALTQEFGYKYIHCSAPKSQEAAREEYLGILDEDTDLILDRSWIGDFVYAPTLRKYNPSYASDIITKIQLKGIKVLALMLYCPQEKLNAMPGDISDREMMSNHDWFQRNFVRQFNYIKYGEKHIFNVANFDNVFDEKQTIKWFVESWLEGKTVFTPFVGNYSLTMFNPGFRFLTGVGQIEPWTNCPKIDKCGYYKAHLKYDFGKEYQKPTSGAGNVEADFAFVGEAPGKLGCGKLGIPFYNDKSGMLFRDALFWNRIGESEVFITNAVKCTPPDNKINAFKPDICSWNLKFELQHAVCYKPKIISLGRTAEGILNELKIKNTYFKHPAAALYEHFDYNSYFRKSMEVLKSG